jgi:CBS-domain-containing membrane protein
MRKAKDIMTTAVITVRSETSIRDLAKLLIEHGINGAPVVDEDENLVGIVTQADLIDQNKVPHIPSVISLLDSFIFLESPKRLEKELKKIAGTTVWDICTREVVTVEDDAGLDEIATLMAERGVYPIPVVRQGRIVGIVGRADVIRSVMS